MRLNNGSWRAGEQLRAPELIAKFVAEYRRERALLNARVKARVQSERRLSQVSYEIERIIDSICDGTADKPRIKPRFAALGAEKDALEAELAEKPDRSEVIDLHPGAVKRYLAQIETLAKALSESPVGPVAGEQFTAFRELVESILVHRSEIGAPIDLEIRGRLAAPPPNPVCHRMGGSAI